MSDVLKLGVLVIGVSLSFSDGRFIWLVVDLSAPLIHSLEVIHLLLVKGEDRRNPAHLVRTMTQHFYLNAMTTQGNY